MKKEKWQTNDEHRVSLRMALYEAKRDEPIKSYDQLGKEFGISSADANKLVIEYCKKFSLLEPPVVLVPGTTYDRNKRMLIGTRVEVNGRSGVLIEEFVHQMKILFDDTRDFELVNRVDLSI